VLQKRCFVLCDAPAVARDLSLNQVLLHQRVDRLLDFASLSSIPDHDWSSDAGVRERIRDQRILIGVVISFSISSR